MKLTSFHHNGLSLLIRDGLSTNAERDIVREVQREYPWDFPITTAIDVGAHIGAWTAWCKHLWPHARIVAVEIDPDTYSILETNALWFPGVSLVHARAGYGAGNYALLRAPHNSGSTSTYRLGNDWREGDYLLAPPAVTLEDLLAKGQFEFVDVLKLDCEGAEIDLLLNAQDDTLMRIQNVIGEIHMSPQEFEDQTNVRLQRAGFHVTYRPHPGDPNLFYLDARREV